MIPYGRQDVVQTDIDAVVAVLRSDFLTQGEVVPRFERAVSARTGAQHAVAFNSATSALHVACLALGLGPGDTLWTVPNTFVASANCARYCGADVNFVDIDPHTWNMCTDDLRRLLGTARASGKLPKVLVPVHFAGQPTRQEEIFELGREFGLRILEDASHSIGAERSGEPVGSCRWSDITVFSFHPVKLITSGEGGMALTNDPELAHRMRLLRTHGITRDASRFIGVDHIPGTQWKPPAGYYEQQCLGFNYRMTDIHAALGLSQLGRLDDYVRRRNDLAARYDELLRGLPLQLPRIEAQNRSAFHLYVVHLGDRNGAKRDSVFESLRRAGIGVSLHYPAVHLQPYYRALGFGPGQFPAAEEHAARALTLPLYPLLTAHEQDEIVQHLSRALADD